MKIYLLCWLLAAGFVCGAETNLVSLRPTPSMVLLARERPDGLGVFGMWTNDFYGRLYSCVFFGGYDNHAYFQITVRCYASRTGTNFFMDLSTDSVLVGKSLALDLEDRNFSIPQIKESHDREFDRAEFQLTEHLLDELAGAKSARVSFLSSTGMVSRNFAPEELYRARIYRDVFVRGLPYKPDPAFVPRARMAPVVKPAEVEGDLKVVNSLFEMTERRDRWARCSYKVELKNLRAEPATYTITVQFLDQRGLVLDHKYHFRVAFGAGEKRSLADFKDINHPLADRVAKIGIVAE